MVQKAATMSNILKLKNLGDFGVNTDLDNVELPPETFSSGRNFKLKDSRIETFNGYRGATASPLTTDSNAKIFRHKIAEPFVATTRDSYIVLGSTKVYLVTGTVWTDVTPTGMAAIPATDTHLWSFCHSGSVAMINHPALGPFYLNETLVQFVKLPYSPTQDWTAHGYYPGLLRSHKEFLFAFAPQNPAGTVIYPNTIDWSAPSGKSGIPTTWDPLDLSTIAGEVSLSGNGQYIVDALSLRDQLVIYSRNSIDGMIYVGGDLIWNLRQFSSDTGLLAQDCVSEFFNKHLFITDGDILINDGNSLNSILDRKLRKSIFSNIDSVSYDKSFTAVNYVDNEVWACLPETGNAYPNLAVVYNWLTGAVYLRDMPLNAMFASTGSSTQSAAPVWSNDLSNWDNNQREWLYNPTSPFDATFMVVTSDGKLQNVLNNDSASQPYDTILERLNVPLGGYGEVSSVKSIYPHIQCEGDVFISAGSVLNLGEGVRWKDAVRFNPATQKKVDIRTTGVFQCWRIASDGFIPFQFSGMDIEYEINGRR